MGESGEGSDGDAAIEPQSADSGEALRTVSRESFGGGSAGDQGSRGAKLLQHHAYSPTMVEVSPSSLSPQVLKPGSNVPEVAHGRVEGLLPEASSENHNTPAVLGEDAMKSAAETHQEISTPSKPASAPITPESVEEQVKAQHDKTSELQRELADLESQLTDTA